MDYKKIISLINFWRTLPFYYLCMHSRHGDKAKKDLDVWKKKHNNLRKVSDFNAFSWLVMNTKEFRNVMFNRLHRNKISYLISKVLFRPLESLYINMPPEAIGGVVLSTWIFDNSSSRIHWGKLFN